MGNLLLEMYWSFIVLELLNSRYEFDDGSTKFNSFSISYNTEERPVFLPPLTNTEGKGSQAVTEA